MVIRVVIGPDYIELQRSCSHCHDQEYTNGLTIQQILSIQQAARTAPGVSAAQLRRNMLTHNSPTKTIGPEHARKIQRIVLKEHKKVMEEQLQGAAVDDSFGSLSVFAEENRWSEMVRKHNYPDNSYHLKMFEFCVIGYKLQAARGIIRINFSSLWMLLNALHSIQAGWVFQLNGDITCDVCRADIDLLQLSVISMPCQNNVLCISTIPHQTESETTYTITWDDLRTAVS
jgi:hypothetical protein